MDRLTEIELRAFVGPKADYYLSKWQPDFETGHARVSKNWAAFLFSAFWLLYRKMYKFMTIFFLAVLLESVFEEIVFARFRVGDRTSHLITSSVGILFSAICGAWGNQWYFFHATKKIAEVKLSETDPLKQLELIAQRGGRNIVSVVIGTFCFLTAWSLIYAVLLYFGVVGY